MSACETIRPGKQVGTNEVGPRCMRAYETRRTDRQTDRQKDRDIVYIVARRGLNRSMYWCPMGWQTERVTIAHTECVIPKFRPQDKET